MVAPRDIITTISGAWILVNTTKTYTNGTTVLTPDDPMLGSTPIGILTYHETGYMSATLMASDSDYRPAELTYPALANQTDAEWAKVGKHILCYAGPVSAREDSPTTGELTHGPLTVADVPSWVGTRQLRPYQLLEHGNLLRFRLNGTDGSFGTLNWRRMGDSRGSSMISDVLGSTSLEYTHA